MNRLSPKVFLLAMAFILPFVFSVWATLLNNFVIEKAAFTGAEIGLLTPPLGISCFVIKASLNDPRISLKDVFLGALPFAFIMLLVLIILINYPILSTALLLN